MPRSRSRVHRASYKNAYTALPRSTISQVGTDRRNSPAKLSVAAGIVQCVTGPMTVGASVPCAHCDAQCGAEYDPHCQYGCWL